MQYIKIALLILISPLSVAESSFEIPRSSIVEIEDPNSKRIYPLFIKLPQSYMEGTNTRFPVIYLTDSWYSFQIVSGATRFPMNFGKMEEAIIVAISYSNGSKGSSSRMRDYTPQKDNSWRYRTGEADDHIKFIESSVIPYVDNSYRTRPASRTFVGNSLGGLLGAYILFTKPELFNSYILGSPSVWYKDEYLLSVKPRKTNRPTKVYVSIGSLEESEKRPMISGAKKLVKKIAAESGDKVVTKLSIIEGARHTTAFPTTAIQGLDWVYGK